MEGYFNKNGKLDSYFNLQGKQDREGTIYFQNGDIYYQGYFLDGEKHGYGVEYNIKGDLIYHGFWLLGKLFFYQLKKVKSLGKDHSTIPAIIV